jgi:hypothetical protein
LDEEQPQKKTQADSAFSWHQQPRPCNISAPQEHQQQRTSDHLQGERCVCSRGFSTSLIQSSLDSRWSLMMRTMQEKLVSAQGLNAYFGRADLPAAKQTRRLRVLDQLDDPHNQEDARDH